MKSSSTVALMALSTLAFAARAQSAPEAKPLIHPMFSDNMVIQRDRPAPVWGWAAPGAKVNVTFRERGYVVEAGPDGRWSVTLPAARAGGPHWLRVATSGAQEVLLKNVMMGDVWVCSGQSNMEQGLATVYGAEKEIAAANYPNIRLYTVPKRTAFQPEWDPRGEWKVCTPETAGTGGWASFSAVAYFFGRNLHQRYGVPIGLIHTSWGGTPAEAWTSAGNLGANLPEFRPAIEQVANLARAAASGQFNYPKELARWVAEKDPGSNTPNGWELTTQDTSDWKTMALPGHWDTVEGMATYDGIVWFRREFDLPESAAGQEATLHLGNIDDGDTTWINGWHVGETHQHQAPRVYKVPAHALKAGRNVIAVRVYDIASNGGFYGKPEDMRLVAGGRTISLAGDWKYRPSVDLATMGPRPQDPNASQPNLPSVLYNGMIAPIPPFAIKGAIWYQGESNSNRARQYQTLLPTMIADWRAAWGQGDFPFFVVQIANFMARKPQPSESEWAELREAQALTVSKVPNTGLAVTIDIGEANDIHPRNKQDVGTRLALAARKVVYGDDIVHSGPTYREHEIAGREIRVYFDNVGAGLSTKDGSRGGNIPGFAVAGEDGQFVWAEARIAGTEVRTADGKETVFGAEAATMPGARVEGVAVVVSHPNVRDPRHVRYAWADNPDAGLYNKAGLPAVPFRTDSGMGRAVQPVRLVTVPPASPPAFSDWHEVNVTVRFRVQPDGRVTDARVVRSSDIRFNRAALDAARRITAEPARVNGEPVESHAMHTYRFQAW